MIRRFTTRLIAVALVFSAMACAAPVQAVSTVTVGDNVSANRGVGFVLMVSIRRNR
ncbi:MAG: hypothetical protein R3D45_05810 [Rhizobiaceae bacterium]